MKRALLAVLFLAAAAACRRGAGQAQAPGSEAPARADSIVLERTRCFGTCPAYRLSLARAGTVRFTSRWPADTPPGQGTVTAAAFDELVAQAGRIGFWQLPDRIQGSPLCRMMVTDLPTATVTLFARGRSKVVEDYHGCTGGPLDELRRFEQRIDSVAGSRRWVRIPQIR